MKRINVWSIESDTHTLFGHAYFTQRGVSIYVNGESWHGYLGSPGFQGFDRELFCDRYKTVADAKRAGWVFEPKKVKK